MSKRWDILILCLVFTAIGATSSWMAMKQAGGGASGAKEEHDDHGEEAADHKDLPELPPATLKNLGVTIGELKVGTFTSYRQIPAVVVRTALNEQPVVAPLGGRVLDVMVEIGMVVKPGQPLVTIVRDPIPRPRLMLTEDILKPANESIHATVVDLRKSAEEIKITKTELDRVEKYTGQVGNIKVPILPRQRAIDLKYQLLRAQKTHEQASLELTKHGFTKEQIETIASGGTIPTLRENNWKLALGRNGLWPESAERLFSVLPPELQKMPWVVATIGELSASGLNRPELAAWLKVSPQAARYFLEIGSLLQQGHTVADVRRLHELNALAPIITVAAPDNAPDWNVDATMVRPGAQVARGENLLTLLNPREMYLKIAPAGGEKADVLRALADKDRCHARPLVPGAGPILEGVTLAFATGEAGNNNGGTLTYAEIANEPLTLTTDSAGRTHRTWKLRSGLKYMLRIPTAKMDNVYVLPSEAVATDGPHKVVFVQDGKSFRTVEVEIAYQDEEYAVIPATATNPIFPGDPVVMTGAFSLGIALKSGDSKPDAHAGHQH